MGLFQAFNILETVLIMDLKAMRSDLSVESQR